jgi:DNA-binding CsgD family transcriptional regulator
METRLSTPAQRTGLRGRETERAVLDELADDVRHGVSRSLVLRGEAGIGKTALLQYLVESASDLTVLRAVGVESEMELAYASLHQLCAPLLDRLERLPSPQRRALETVFGLSSGTAPDRFLVGLGILSVLSQVADERPLLCVVDDAQWLDQASASTLAFVARRLLAEPIGMVFAARDGDDEFRPAAELEVNGLPSSDARELLSAGVGVKLDERVWERIVAETRGNPLALLELPRGLTATQLAGGFELICAKALPERIEQSYIRRVEGLSEDARRLLLLAAAEPVGDAVLLERAAERLGIGPEATEIAEAHGLLAIGERVTFRHPLVRSAVYRLATAEERRRVHSALAEATDRHIDPDRRAWHLAAAAAGPDDQVALELERSAGRAQARGGLAAAAAFLQRAVALTHDPTGRAECALAAAQACFQAGAFDAALRLVATAEAGPLDDFERAQSNLLRGYVAAVSRYGDDAAPLLLQAARRLEPFDLDLARRAYLTAWGAAVAAGHLGGAEPLLEICHAVRGLPPPPAAPHPLDLVLDGLTLLTTDGRAAAAPVLQCAAKAVAQMPVEDVLRWGWLAPAASAAMWDPDGSRATFERQVRLVRDAGALAELPLHLHALAQDKARTGEFADAASLIAESDTVATATGSQIPPFAELTLRSLEGRETEAFALIQTTLNQSAARGQGLAVMAAYWATAVLSNGLARYDEAVCAAREVTVTAIDPWQPVFALPELVEAAARAGDLELAADALERLAETTRPARTDLALGIEARSRALLSAGATAERLYREGIGHLGRTQVRPDLARAHLLYGEWLRRERRRVEAREQLRTAHEMFTDIGMEAFAERTRGELLATGAKVRKRIVERGDELTAQERHIAQLARDGMSNSEIGVRLFLSQHTVAYHLRKVFGKLGIRSRRELVAALPSFDLEPISNQSGCVAEDRPRIPPEVDRVGQQPKPAPDARLEADCAR